MTAFGELVDQVTREIRGCLSAVNPCDVDRAVEEITRSGRVFLAGAGRSGSAIRAHAVRLMHAGKTVHAPRVWWRTPGKPRTRARGFS